MATYNNYINGHWVGAASKKTIKIENPATRQSIGTCARSDHRDVDAAVKAAKIAFPKWKKTPAPKRADILYAAVRLLEKNKERLANLMVKEMGKVMEECLGDVQEGIDLGYYMAGEGRRLQGQTIPSELENKHIRTVREPVGVFGLITPWNFPIAIPSWKIFPALVCGNTIIFKPSELTPVCATELVKIFEQAGLPKGVLNLVHGFGPEAGWSMVTHPDVNGISFTGSAEVGSLVGEHCGKTFKKHSLEMGGKNVVTVLDDADIDLAVQGCIWGGFGTSGQRCTAASRVVVHKKVYNEFKRKFVKKVKQLKIGYGWEKGTDIGPLIEEASLKKVERYMALAKMSNIKILCGGKRALSGKLKDGHFFEPTVIDNPPRNHAISCEEIFGPVVSLHKANDFKDAVELANNVIYGLSSAIFTRDVNKAHMAADLLESGIVYINSATIGAEIQAPFGGVKNTGNGHREAGGMGGALETYTNMKVINTDFSGAIQKAQGIKWD